MDNDYSLETRDMKKYCLQTVKAKAGSLLKIYVGKLEEEREQYILKSVGSFSCM